MDDNTKRFLDAVTRMNASTYTLVQLNQYAPLNDVLTFRVYNEYETKTEVIDGEETTIRKAVAGSGFKDVAFDYKDKHSDFYLKLADCIPTEMYEGEMIPKLNAESHDFDYELFNSNLHALIDIYGNLGCSSIKQKVSMKQEADTYVFLKQDAAKREPSKFEVVDIEGVETFVYMANYDVVEPHTLQYGDLYDIPNNPTLYKAVWDLKQMLNAYQSGNHVNLNMLNAHLSQCNVSVSTKVVQTENGIVYELAPNADNLLGIAFWQLQQLLLKNNPAEIGTCEMCGKYFERRSHLGRFCNDVSIENGIKVKSGCSSAYNSLKTRVKKKYISDASLTVEDLVLKHKRSAKYVREFVAEWEAKGLKRKAPAEK